MNLAGGRESTRRWGGGEVRGGPGRSGSCTVSRFFKLLFFFFQLGSDAGGCPCPWVERGRRPSALVVPGERAVGAVCSSWQTRAVSEALIGFRGLWAGAGAVTRPAVFLGGSAWSSPRNRAGVECVS